MQIEAKFMFHYRTNSLAFLCDHTQFLRVWFKATQITEASLKTGPSAGKSKTFPIAVGKQGSTASSEKCPANPSSFYLCYYS